MSNSVGSVDQRVQALAVMLEPVLALARILGMSLDDLQRLVAVGYYREYALRGLSQPQLARYLGKSVRTVASLAKSSSARGPLLDTSRRLQLQREVVHAGSLGPVGVREARQMQPRLAEADVRDVLEQMVVAGLIDRTDDGRYVARPEHVDMVRDDLDARLDSLRHFLTGVAHVVYGRFFRASAGAEAFARVWSFTATRERLAELRQRHYAAIRDDALVLDAEERDEKVQASALLVVVERPDDLAWRRRR